MSLMDGTIPEPMGRPPCPGLGWAKQIWGIDCSGSGPNSHFISILLSKDKGVPGELIDAIFLRMQIFTVSLSVPVGWHVCLFQDLP